jgi:hypothetical protein
MDGFGWKAEADANGPNNLFVVWTDLQLSANSKSSEWPPHDERNGSNAACHSTVQGYWKDAPVPRAVGRAGHIDWRPVLGGLHHQYDVRI